jgi:hypothetical protein
MELRSLIKRILSEMPITKKSKFGSGMFHDIYSFKQFPDRLFKVGTISDVEEWLEVFSSKKKLFPKVYSAKKMKNRPDLYYVEIEKLDTDRVIKEWQIIESGLELAGIVDLDEPENSVDFVFSNIIALPSIYAKYKTALRSVDMAAYNLFVKWVPFLQEVQEIVEKVAGKDLDLHRYNFGYSGNQMKCLDI